MTTNKTADVSGLAIQTGGADIVREKLLDAKRNLQKAQSEVDDGDNDPYEVSTLIEMALDDVMAAISIFLKPMSED